MTYRESANSTKKKLGLDPTTFLVRGNKTWTEPPQTQIFKKAAQRKENLSLNTVYSSISLKCEKSVHFANAYFTLSLSGSTVSILTLIKNTDSKLQVENNQKQNKDKSKIYYSKKEVWFSAALLTKGDQGQLRTF